MRSPGCHRDEQETGRVGEWGFTLPELLATIVIIGIVAAIAIPSFFALIEARRVESAANQLASDLRLSHSRATNQVGTDWHMVIRPDGSSFTCGPASDADYCLVGIVTSPTPSVSEISPKYFPGNVKITGKTNFPNETTPSLPGYPTGNRATLEFNSDGSANVISSSTPTGDPTIEVGEERKVVITPVTSKIEVEQ